MRMQIGEHGNGGKGMFRSDDTFFRSLRNLIRKMHALGDRAMAPYGMSHAEMRVLLSLYSCGPDGCNQEYLASRLNVDPTNVGRSLKKLEALGYVRRMRSRDDGRANHVFLTEKGDGIRDVLIAVKNDIEARATRRVSPSELEFAAKVLETMDEGLSSGV